MTTDGESRQTKTDHPSPTDGPTRAITHYYAISLLIASKNSRLQICYSSVRFRPAPLGERIAVAVRSLCICGIHEIGSGDSHNVKDWNLGILGAMLGDGPARGNIKKEDVGNWILEHL